MGGASRSPEVAGHVVRYREGLIALIPLVGLVAGMAHDPPPDVRAAIVPGALGAVLMAWHLAGPRLGLLQWAMVVCTGMAALVAGATISFELHPAVPAVYALATGVLMTLHGWRLAPRSAWAVLPMVVFGGVLLPPPVQFAWWGVLLVAVVGLVRGPAELRGFNRRAARRAWAEVAPELEAHDEPWGVRLVGPDIEVRAIGAVSPPRVEVEVQVPTGLSIRARTPGTGRIGEGTGDLVLDTALEVSGTTLDGLHEVVLPVICDFGATVQDGRLSMTLGRETMVRMRDEWYPTRDAAARIQAARALARALQG